MVSLSTGFSSILNPYSPIYSCQVNACPAIMFSIPTNVFLLLGGIATVSCYYCVSNQRYKRKLPPGPKGLPILGNVLDVPAVRQWETFRDWGNQYGEHRLGCSFHPQTLILYPSISQVIRYSWTYHYSPLSSYALPKQHWIFLIDDLTFTRTE